MVAVVTGTGLGVENSSGWVLGSRGQLGSASFGRFGENVYVNAATGNLAINRTDEILIGQGPDDAIARTYNSLGLSLSKLRRYQEAFEAFKAGGSVASAYNNLGFVYLNEARNDKAVECFEKAIASSPEFYVRASENLKTARTSSFMAQ